MSAPTKEARLQAKHAFFRQEFDAIQAAVRDVRIQCLSDRRFYSIAGAQWEGALGDQFANKPRFEFNKTHLAVLRIINEYRNNRVTVDFAPKDGADSDKLADTCDGLFRADEADSGAQEAYDTAFEEGVAGGMGAIRLRARYVDEDDDEDDRQRVAIEPIFEADTCVFFSLDGKRQDKADASRCYVLTSMTPSQYEDEYGDSPASWPKGIEGNVFDWNTPDVVWLAEVYEVEQKSELVHFFHGIALTDEPNELRVPHDELTDEKLRELTATGFREVRQKRVKVRKVHKYIMNGNRVLDDCGIIAGACIPVVPFYGKRWFVDGVERCQGHVRLARDAQQLDNMVKSWLAEMAARFDIEKPILTPEQIAGHATMWARDSIEKYPYLLVNPIIGVDGNPIPAGPLAYTKAPNMPPAMAALAQLAAQSLEDMLGNQQAGEQLQPNQSGKAVELIQNRLDMQVFIYMDNFSKTVKRIGEVWLSMMKDIAVEPGRKMKSIDKNGTAASIELLRPVMGENGEEVENDLGAAKFDVAVDVGPSSSSRRAATVRALTGMLQMTTDPEVAMVLSSMAMLNMEGEGLSDTHDWFRQRLIRMGAVKPNEAEKKQMQAEQQNAQPDPNAQFLMASAQKEMAMARKAEADTLLTAAKTEETHIATIAAAASIQQGEQQHLLDLMGQAKQHDDAEAARQLDAAIALHEQHMNGTAPTDERSQMEMMQQMQAARAALGGTPPRQQQKMEM